MGHVRYAVVLLLLLTSSVFALSYWGAEYRTREAFLYGRFETSCKPPRGNGILASFFTYHDITDSTDWNEIDYEILGRYSDDVQVTSIGPGQKWRNSHHAVDFVPQDGFHTYAFEWTPEYIAWFIDGAEIYRQDQAHIRQFKYPQKIMMNLWSSESAGWVGPWDDRILPLFAWYDWVSYASYTPGAGNTGSGNNFTQQWRDDFDRWDAVRWTMGTHTFNGNRVTFRKENVVFRDGCMVLCMTKGTDLGFTDKIPPCVLWARADLDTVTVRFSEAIDPATATKANFAISGITILNAALQSDQQTVKLAVSALDTSKRNNVVAMNIKDTFTPPNKLSAQLQQILVSKPLALPVKINVGGKAWRDYLTDQEWGPEVEYGYQDGAQRDRSKPIVGIDIRDTEEDTLYHTELHELVDYKVRLPQGRYKVTLKMAELTFTEPEDRVFNIYVEGRKVADRLDLAAIPGPKTALELTADDVAVNDGILDVRCEYLWGYELSGWGSLLNGLVIERAAAGVQSGAANMPEHPALVRNFPNPFNAATTISWEVPEAGRARLRIFDRLGREVAELANGPVAAGVHQITWVPDLPSGLYLADLEHRSGTLQSRALHKLILLR
ncbi:MAG TPA: family 16 glycosylhydrolase [bacterium]|nr:family 16 glycosylhydrolase [bacterium]